MILLLSLCFLVTQNVEITLWHSLILTAGPVQASSLYKRFRNDKDKSSLSTACIMYISKSVLLFLFAVFSATTARVFRLDSNGSMWNQIQRDSPLIVAIQIFVPSLGSEEVPMGDTPLYLLRHASSRHHVPSPARLPVIIPSRHTRGQCNLWPGPQLYMDTPIFCILRGLLFGFDL